MLCMDFSVYIMKKCKNSYSTNRIMPTHTTIVWYKSSVILQAYLLLAAQVMLAVKKRQHINRWG